MKRSFYPLALPVVFALSPLAQALDLSGTTTITASGDLGVPLSQVHFTGTVANNQVITNALKTYLQTPNGNNRTALDNSVAAARGNSLPSLDIGANAQVLFSSVGSNNHRLDVGNTAGILYARSGGKLSISDTVSNPALGGVLNVGENGLMIIAAENANQPVFSFANNQSEDGGALHSTGVLWVSHASFDNNKVNHTVSAQGNTNFGGGAIQNEKGTLLVSDSVFTNNQSDGYAGAILNASGRALILDSTFTNNGSATTINGGALANRAGTMTVDNSGFLGNKADRNGGAISGTSGSLLIDNSRFEDNQASGSTGVGGGLYNSNGTVTVSGATYLKNQAAQSGGAIYSSGGTMSLNGTSFYGNVAGSDGGAIWISGPLALTLQAGTEVNFAGNTANGKSNAIHFVKDPSPWASPPTFKIVTMVRSTLHLYDPITTDDALALILTKESDGTWEQGGVSDLGNANITIQQGTLSLLAAGNKDFTVPAVSASTATNNYSWTAGALELNVQGSFTLNPGATLKADGNNRIFGGTQSFAGTMSFDMDGAQADTSSGSLYIHHPILSVDADAIGSALPGANIVRVYNVTNLPQGIYTLVDSYAPDRTAKGTLYLGDSPTPYVSPGRRDRPSSDVIMGLVQLEDERYLELQIGPADGNTELTWHGQTNLTWDKLNSKNWDGTLFGEKVDVFLDGDSVRFESYSRNATIAIDGDKTVNNMTVSVPHTFTGGSVTVDGILTLRVTNDNTATLIMSDPGQDLILNDTQPVNLALMLNTSDGILKKQTVAKVAGEIKNFDTGKITINGSAPVTDYLHSVVNLVNRNEIELEAMLAWYDPGVNKATGTFTLSAPTDRFTLGVVLRDHGERDPTVNRALWDGKSLIKNGDGVLTLLGNNIYSGTTSINDGELALGTGGATGMIQSPVINNAILRFNRSDDIEFGQPVSGVATATIYKDGLGALTLSADNSRYLGKTVVNRGTLVLTGALGGSVDVATGATLTLKNHVSGAITVPGNANLNIYQGASMGDLMAAGSSGRGGNLHFFIQPTIKNNDVVSTAAIADLSNSQIHVGIDGGTDLTAITSGATVILLQASNLITQKPPQYATAKIGSTIVWDVNYETTSDQLLMHFGQSSGGSGGGGGGNSTDEAQDIPEGEMPGLGGILNGADMVADQAMRSQLLCAPNCRALQVFGIVQGADQRLHTPAHARLTGFNLLQGITASRNFAHERMGTIGAFFEYGNAVFDTHRRVAGKRIESDGDSRYYGTGFLGRFDFAPDKHGHFYSEASLRIGRVKNKFHSNDIVNAYGVAARYNHITNYWGAAASGGYLWQLTPKNRIDLYGRFLWTQLASDSTRLSTGERLKFETINSYRARLGTRYFHALDEAAHSQLYAGLAYEYEFSGEVKTTTNGVPIRATDLKGSTGIAEVGIDYTPTSAREWNLDAALYGYVGERKGFAGRLRVQYRF